MGIKWFRKRHEFEWEGIKVCLDFTKSYGYILELEKMCTEDAREQTLNLLKERFALLNIPLTTREEFDRRFHYYKEHWKTLTGEG